MRKRATGTSSSSLTLSAALAAAAWQFASPATAQVVTPAQPATPTTAPPRASAPEQVAPPAESDESNRVVVTGSFIRGTPEDAAIPVQVTTLEDLQNLGNPTGLDLIKNFTAVGGLVAGEQNRNNTFPLNYSSANLRGLGASRTLVLFNGHRFAEQFSYGALAGRSTNINQIPQAAIARVETVTDGGSTTYGADAVGGVINYITRHDFDGLEASANYRFIPDSNGDYGATLLWGHNFDNGNILVSAEWNKRNPLKSRDRDFAAVPYLENPTGQGAADWTSTGNPGSFSVFTTNTAASAAISNAATATGVNSYVGDYQMGATGVVRDPACNNLGGFSGWSAALSPICYFSLDSSFDRLSEDTNSTNIYSEINFDISEKLHFHAEGGWYSAYTNGSAHPSDANVGFGLPATSIAGATVPTVTGVLTVPGSNPAVRDILNKIRNSNGTTAFTQAQIDAVAATGRITLNSWRPFLEGGNPLHGEDSYHRIQSNLFRISGGLSGDLDPMYGFDIKWDTALTYSRTLYQQKTEDIRTDRLINALNGFGGPNCKTSATVTTLVAGANGCQYFNPFSSGVASNYYTGVTNTTTYNPALVNSIDLIKWMYVPLKNDRTFDQFSYDLVFNAETPFELPGGAVEVAAGMQWRFNRQDDRLDNFSNINIAQNVCTLPPGANPAGTPQALTGCTGNGGDLYFGRPGTVFGPNTEQTRRFPVLAFFYEANLPITNDWSVSTSGRSETFYADLTPTKTTTFVPQIQSKYQITDWLAVRGTASQTFSYVQQPFNDGSTDALSTADLLNTGGVSFGIGATTAARYNTSNFDNTDIQPEKGTNYNFGVLFRLDDGKFNASIDYYDITITDYLRTITPSQLVTALVMPGQTGANAQINCSSSLLSDNNVLFGGRPTIELNGPCVQGTSTLSSASGGFAGLTAATQGRINYFGATRAFNGGDYRTSGLDLSASYRMEDIVGGDLTVSANATKVLKNGLEDFDFQGVNIAPGFDGVGSLNLSTSHASIGPVPEWKATLGFNYKYDVQSFNLNARYTSPMRSDVPGNFIEAAANNANIGNASGFVACAVDTNPVYNGVPTGAGSGQYGSDLANGTTGYCADQNLTNYKGFSVPPSFNLDFVYRAELPFDASVLFTIYNLLDADPKFSREKFNYNGSTGSPLGRNFKIEVRKTF